MRTTLDIDDDVLGVAKAIAAQRHESAGRIVSDLLRLALQKTQEGPVRNGIALIPRQAGASPTTMATVNRLRDEE